MKKKVCYFIACNAEIKIGYTENWAARRRYYERKFGLVEDLGVIPGDRAKEREFHRMFAEHARHGEWFDDTKEVRLKVSQLVAAPHEPPPTTDHGWFGRMLKKVFPQDTAHTAWQVTGAYSEKSWRNWIEGRTTPRGGVLLPLLASDNGAEILCEIMDGCEENWWLELRPLLLGHPQIANQNRDWLFVASTRPFME